MKYIKRRTQYLFEQVSWIETKQKDWDSDFNKLMMSFHDNISDLIVEIKDKFNDKDDPDEVYNTYKEYMESAFDSLIEEVRYVQDDNYLHKFWNEFKLNLYLWKDTFSKLSEKVENYNSVFKLGYEVFSKLGVYITKKVSDEYYNVLKGDIDTKRQNVVEFLENLYTEVKVRMDDIEPEEIFSMSNLDQKNSDEIVLNAGDEVRYYKSDGEENTALISYNQEELQDEDNNVRLVSKSDGEQFEIDKSELIEILPKHKTINQEVSDKLKRVKSDPDKLDKLNNYLDELTTEEMGNILDWTEQEDKVDLKITRDKTKIWMSNPTFKVKYIKAIGDILRNVYKPLGHWKKYNTWGVMDLPWEENSWSILNKVNTNYSALKIIINETNRAIIDGGSKTDPFNFNDVAFGSKKFYEEFDRFLQFLNKHRNKIFLKLDKNTGSKLINEVINVIQRTSSVGKKAEDFVARKLPSMLNGMVTNVETPDGDGQLEDMEGGIDITFSLNGDPKTLQVKKSKSVFLSDDNRYMVTGVNLSKHYNVDYIACVVKGVVYLFRYNSEKITIFKTGNIKIDEDLFITKSNPF